MTTHRHHPVASVRRHGGYPTLFINDEPHAAHFYYFPLPVSEHIAAFARAGVHLFTWGWGSHINHSMDMGWTGPGQFSYGKVDDEIATILDADPNAWLIPRIGVAAPRWWLEAHPDHRVRFDDGTTTEHGRETDETSPTSQCWRKEAGEALARMIAHMCAQPYAARIIGYQVTGGMNEWFYAAGAKLPDFSPVALAAFRDWLRARYATEDTLRAAWRDPSATFEAAEIPTREARFATSINLLRDPVAFRPVVDYYQFLSEVNADALLHFCRIVKEASAGQSLAGAFYGYLQNMAAGYSEGYTALHWGHNALRRVLAAPEVDFLCAPNHYTWTGPGGYDGSQSLPDTVQLHGKLWMSEMDQLTCRGRGESTMRSFATFPQTNPTPTLEQTLDRMTRDFAHSFTARQGLWWMEQDRHFCRYQHPAVLALVERMQALFARDLSTDVRRNAEVAVFIDEETPYHLKPGPELLNPLRYTQVMYHLCRIGAPIDLYLHNDLARDDFPAYKLYVFLDTLYLTADERQAIRRAVQRDGRTALWMVGPGIMSEAGIDPSQTAELTGMAMGMRPAVGWSPGGPLQQYLCDHDHPITRGIRPGLVFGTDAPIGPMIFVDDPEATALGTLIPLHTRSGPTGFAVREFPDWRSVFCATPGLPADLLRNIARYAVCHIYTDEDDVVYGNSRYLAIHALRGGEKAIRLPEPIQVRDAFTRDLVADGVIAFTDHFRPGGTRLYQLDRTSRG